MESAVEVPADLVVSSLTDLYYTRYTALSWGIIIVFDHLITLGQEVELVWKERFTFASALFFVNRYYALFAAIFNCYVIHATGHSQTDDGYGRVYIEGYNWLQWQACTAIFAQSAITQAILILRVRALYLNNRTVTLVIVGNFLVAMAAAIVINHHMLAQLTVRAVSLQGKRVCSLGVAPRLTAAYYIPIAAFETLLAVLAVARWVRDGREGKQDFLQALVRDSVVYFIVMTLAYTVNVVMWVVLPRILELPVGLVMSLSSVMASRLLFNIRERRRRSLPCTTFDCLPCGATSEDTLVPWYILEEGAR